MAEYIARNTAKRWLAFAVGTGVSAAETIDQVPAADVAPVVHGRWKYYHKQNKAVCTSCSFERNLDENFGAAISCPNCWAKMDGGDSTHDDV